MAPKKKIVLSGFSRYKNAQANVTDNPSQHVVKQIASVGLPDDLYNTVQLETIVFDVVYERVEKYISDRVLTGKADYYVHVGVLPGATEVKVNSQAKSCKYEVPDAVVKLPANCRAKFGPDYNDPQVLQTSLDCAKVVEALNAKFGEKVKSAVSDDPGMFVGGYLYFNSLQIFDRKAVYIQIPQFSDTITKEVLVGVVEEVIRQVLAQNVA